MADTVRHLMEAMIPELEDFHKKGYFTKQELKQVVKKREKFEYLLKRRAARKEDFLRYIEYEQKLEQLRALRKRKLHIEGKASLADHAIVKRLHFILRRAATKFKADVAMWLQWLAFCQQTNSARMFSKVATRALALHPNCAALWAQAAVWEFERNGNARSARLLMQQGLRQCRHEPALWVEYFRMELMYAYKLRARRKVAGLPVPGKKSAPVSEQEQQQQADPAGPDIALEDTPAVAATPTPQQVDTEAATAQDTILKGLLALVVARHAMAAFPSNLGLRRQLLQVASEFKFPGMKAIRELVYASVKQEFSHVEEGWDLLARRHSHQDASPSAQELESSCSVYEKAVLQLPSIKMFSLYAAFLRQELRAALADPDQVALAAAVAQKLLSLFKRVHGAGVADEEWYLTWHRVALQLQQPKIALAALKHGCSLHSSSTALWALRLEFEFSLAGAAPPPAATSGAADGVSAPQPASQRGSMPAALRAAVWEALKQVQGHEGASVWKQALQLLASFQDCSPDVEQFTRELLKMLMSLSKGPLHGGLGEVAGLLLQHVQQQQGISQARQLFQQLGKVPCAGGDMFRAMISLEHSELRDHSQLQSVAAQPKRHGSAAQRLKLVFEAAVGAYGEQDTELWVQYASWLVEQGQGPGDVCWRATKALADPDQFLERFRQLQQGLC